MPFVKEIVVVVVRSAGGQTFSYPVVEMAHKDNICHLIPALLRSRDSQIVARAQDIAERTAKCLSSTGVFGLEMFLIADGAFKYRFHSQKNHGNSATSPALKVKSS